jgi:hypothetical protein
VINTWILDKYCLEIRHFPAAGEGNYRKKEGRDVIRALPELPLPQRNDARKGL